MTCDMCGVYVCNSMFDAVSNNMYKCLHEYTNIVLATNIIISNKYETVVSILTVAW